MTRPARKLLDEVLALPADERRALMEAVSDSFDGPPAELSPEWRAEIAGRLAEVERGDVEPVAWTEVESKIRDTLSRR